MTDQLNRRLNCTECNGLFSSLSWYYKEIEDPSKPGVMHTSEATLYNYCAYFAFLVGLLIWAVWLRIRTWYGETTVNKLVLKPFDTAIYALTARAISVII